MVGVVYIINCFKGVQKMRTGKLIMYFLFYFFSITHLDLIDRNICDIDLSMENRKVYGYFCWEILFWNSMKSYSRSCYGYSFKMKILKKVGQNIKKLFRKKQLYSFIQHFCQHLNKIIQKIWTISELAGRSILLYKFHMASWGIPHQPPLSSYFD